MVCLQTWSDSDLLKEFAGGNEDCLKELLRRHQRSIFLFIKSQVRDHALAEDLFQETMIRLIRTVKSEGYREEGKFMAWIKRIAQNLVLDYFRSKQRDKRLVPIGDDYDVFERHILEHAAENDRYINHEYWRKNLRVWMRTLPPDIRKVVVMRTFLDLSFKEIADITGVPINTALGRMRNGVLKMRKLHQEGEAANNL